MENEERAQLEANTKKRWTILEKKSQGLLVYSNRPWETNPEKQHI